MTWVHSHVVRRLPDEVWIRTRFLRRTIGEIIEDGFTLAYAPCVDRSLTTMAILGFAGVESYVVFHDAPSGIGHLVMEVQLEDGSWMWCDYLARESRLYDGRYRFGQVPDNIPRLLRLKGPRYHAEIWDASPPLRLLASVGLDLGRRFARLEEALPKYQEWVHTDEFSLSDRLVRQPNQSVYADIWRARRVVTIDSVESNCIDLSDVHLVLQRE